MMLSRFRKKPAQEPDPEPCLLTELPVELLIQILDQTLLLPKQYAKPGPLSTFKSLFQTCSRLHSTYQTSFPHFAPRLLSLLPASDLSAARFYTIFTSLVPFEPHDWRSGRSPDQSSTSLSQIREALAAAKAKTQDDSKLTRKVLYTLARFRHLERLLGLRPFDPFVLGNRHHYTAHPVPESLDRATEVLVCRFLEARVVKPEAVVLVWKATYEAEFVGDAWLRRRWGDRGHVRNAFDRKVIEIITEMERKRWFHQFRSRTADSRWQRVTPLLYEGPAKDLETAIAMLEGREEEFIWATIKEVKRRDREAVKKYKQDASTDFARFSLS